MNIINVVEWSRAQFALTACYHWLFVPLTLGLGIIVAVMETVYYRTRKQEWLSLTKFWMTLFLWRKLRYRSSHGHYPGV